MIPTIPASARWLYSMIELRFTPGTTSPLQNGQPFEARAGGPAAQAGVGHAHDPADDHEQEGGDERGERQPPVAR